MRRVNFRISLEAATGSGTSGGGGGGEEGDGNRQLDGERQEAANQFYPLQELLQEAVKQEKLVWKKTKGVRLNPNDDEFSTIGSVTSVLSASTLTSLPDPNTTYLIRYGQLTEDLHKYFRKLEKEHACLHLTGRKAIFENLRLHPDDASPNATTTTTTATNGRLGTAAVPETHRSTELHILKDEELLVYRCALMCAQFPMLSAPCPPNDRSPTPHLPTPLINTAQMGTTVPTTEGFLAVPVPVPMSSSAPQATAAPLHVPQPLRHPPPPPPSTSSDNRSHTPNLEKKATGRSSVPLKDDSHKQGHSASAKSKPKRSLRIPIKDQYTDDEDDDDEELSRLSDTFTAGFSDGPLGREQPFTPMVNREMLCSLVRCSFQQTEEQQLQFEQILRHEYGRRSKGEILARELVAQQQVLENNAHPFYKPRNFVTRNGYEIWMQAEKARIKEHLDKFWHYQLPRPLTHSSPTDYHRAYSCLLEKLICYESRSPRREPVHGGRTPSAPLSPTSQRLLTEFGLRFGVGELYRRLAYLDYLAKHFDYEAWYIRHCTNELKTIRSSIPRNRTKMATTRQEMDILKKTVHLLHGQADNSLTRITRLFQDERDPCVGVAALIELLREVLDAEQVLFNNKRVRSLDESLKRYLRSGFVLRYERRKEIISDEIISRNNAAPFMLTPVLVNSLLLAIREEVYDFQKKYQSVFRRYFNIVPLSQVEFYRLICSDACTLCARVIHNPASRQKLNLEMVGLLYRLNDRDVTWCRVIPTEMQQWRNQFVHLALIWLEVLTKQANQWILSAANKDKWGPLSISAPAFSSASSTASSLPECSSGLLPIASPFQPPMIPSQHSSAFTRVVPSLLSRNVSPMTETSGGVSESSYSYTSNESTAAEFSPVKHSQLVHVKSGSGSSNSPLNFGRSEETLIKFGETLTTRSPGPAAEYGNVSDHEEEREDSAAVKITLVKNIEPPATSSDPHVEANEEEDGRQSEDDEETGDIEGEEAKHHTVNHVINGFINPSYADEANEEDEFEEEEVKEKFPSHRHEDYEENVARGLSPDSTSGSCRTLPSRPPQLSIVRHTPYSPQQIQDDELPDGSSIRSDNQAITPRPPSTNSVDQQSFLLPLSSSPIDILTIFTRIASFVGVLLEVLTPKLQQGYQSNRSMPSSTELPSEVAQVREQIAEIQRQTETMRIEFLKKLHKMMVNSLKLYADNLLCMDLCSWPHHEARDLLGDEMMHHLQRRKDNQEIWGCRHVVEARFGLHPDGIPCQRKTSNKFDHITRDMCVRVNNIHALISIFPSLESHIYSTTFSPAQRFPFAATNECGLSSTTATESASLLQSLEAHTQRPNPHRYRSEQRNSSSIQLLPARGGSDKVSSDASVYASPAQRRKSETGFQSGESRQLMEYLNKTLEYQLEMLSIRFNKFFQPALSLLLGLRLSKSIEDRLDPVVTYLLRHRDAFRKYLYPQCFRALMAHIWTLIVQDMEEEALKLLKEKRPVTYQAHQLVQTVAHFIKVMEDGDDDALSMDKMVISTEYLLALLEMFVQSTDRLIRAFGTLNAPQLTNTQVTLNHSPVPIDTPFLHSLRSRLHSIRKCFSGSEFVEAIIKIGQERQEQAMLTSDSGQTFVYNQSYATQIGQYLLDEGILVCLLQYGGDQLTNGQVLESASAERMNAVDTTHHTAAEQQHFGRTLASPRIISSPASSTSSQSVTSLHEEDVLPRVFKNSSLCLYRFVDMEDQESGFVLHSMQVLTAALSSQQANGSRQQNQPQQERRRRESDLSDFDRARLTTQLMITDILQQRVRRDKQAKIFLVSPHALQVMERADQQNIHTILRT